MSAQQPAAPFRNALLGSTALNGTLAGSAPRDESPPGIMVGGVRYNLTTFSEEQGTFTFKSLEGRSITLSKTKLRDMFRAEADRIIASSAPRSTGAGGVQAILDPIDPAVPMPAGVGAGEPLDPACFIDNAPILPHGAE